MRILFIGEYEHSIDTKGRLIIPSKFREELQKKFFITKGMDQCLFVFTEEEFRIMSQKVNTLGLSSGNRRGFARLFYSGATECSLDKQGRILINPGLRNYASIEEKVSIIGVSNRIEIWDTNRWQKYSNSDNLNYDMLTQEMTEIDL